MKEHHDKDLSRIADLSADDFTRLLHAGDTVRDNPCWNRSLLQGDTVARGIHTALSF